MSAHTRYRTSVLVMRTSAMTAPVHQTMTMLSNLEKLTASGTLITAIVVPTPPTGQRHPQLGYDEVLTVK